MATELRATLDRIVSKSNILLEKYNAQVEQNARLREQLRSLTAEVEKLRIERERLLMDLKYMKIARSVAPHESNAKAASEAISRMVRDIDKCISQLNE